jgi:hypothetical protein
VRARQSGDYRIEGDARVQRVVDSYKKEIRASNEVFRRRKHCWMTNPVEIEPVEGVDCEVDDEEIPRWMESVVVDLRADRDKAIGRRYSAHAEADARHWQASSSDRATGLISDIPVPVLRVLGTHHGQEASMVSVQDFDGSV